MSWFTCPICGICESQSSGCRPKTYCSPNCREYAKFKGALERAILKLHPTSKASSLIRGDMFRLANLLSNGTKRPGIKNKNQGVSK